MHGLDVWTPFQITEVHGNLTVPLKGLPRQSITGVIQPRVAGVPPRCRIFYDQTENKGGYGLIQRIRRQPAPPGAPELCVKSPHDAHYSLSAEALTQWLAASALEKAGVHGAIPHVYDIYEYIGETRFSMEYIQGKSAVDTVANSQGGSPHTVEGVWLQILAQASLLLGYLGETIRIDHRDLKADNLWIRWRPVDYTLRVGGVTWRLTAPFQVVILDFGFACLGGEDGNSVVSLSDGYLPALDPCPKGGRDMLYLVGSMWSLPSVRARMSAEFAREMDQLLSQDGANYNKVTQLTSASEWIILKVSDPAFKYEPLMPANLLPRIQTLWRGCGTLERVGG